MITTIFLFIIASIFSIIGGILPVVSIWPPGILASFTMFGASLATVNFIIDTYDLVLALNFFIQFVGYYVSFIILVFIIKTIRGN